jgi:hypothetical protein
MWRRGTTPAAPLNPAGTLGSRRARAIARSVRATPAPDRAPRAYRNVCDARKSTYTAGEACWRSTESAQSRDACQFGLAEIEASDPTEYPTSTSGTWAKVTPAVAWARMSQSQS